MKKLLSKLEYWWQVKFPRLFWQENTLYLVLDDPNGTWKFIPLYRKAYKND